MARSDHRNAPGALYENKYLEICECGHEKAYHPDCSICGCKKFKTKGVRE